MEVIVVGIISPPAKRAAIAMDSPTQSPAHQHQRPQNVRSQQLIEATAMQEDRNEAIDIYDHKLLDKWRCSDNRCINEGGICFVTPFEDHYK